jgi:hypothetical protein
MEGELALRKNLDEFGDKPGFASLYWGISIVKYPIIPCSPNTPGHDDNDIHE